MKIGVFDSGVGGLSVVNAIKARFSDIEVIYREDRQNLPYGTKTPEQLYSLVLPILDDMVKDGCDVIVIACNTVTTTIISELRVALPVLIVGMEPMVKPAASITKTGVIAVFATPTTLKSLRYAWLKSEYCENVAVIEPDCSNWAKMVEDNKVDRDDIKNNVDIALESNADVIVLGCTHYHWIEDLIKELAIGKAKVLQPTNPVLAQLNRVIEGLKQHQ